MGIKIYFFVFIGILLLFNHSHAFKEIYNALPEKISLSYKHTKRLPIIIRSLESTNDKYRYTIKINGITTYENEYIRVYLTNENGYHLSNPFSLNDVRSAYLVLNNYIYNVNELYLNIEYYNPSSITHIYDVYVEFTPMSSLSQHNSYSLSYGVVYNIKVYVNAFLENYYDSSSSSGGSSSSNENDEYYVKNEQKNSSYFSEIHHKFNDSELDHPSNISEYYLYDTSNDSVANISTLYYYKEKKSNNSDNIYESNNENNSDHGNIFVPYTGKIIGLKDISLSTYIIIIIGLLVLYGLWRWL